MVSGHCSNCDEIVKDIDDTYWKEHQVDGIAYCRMHRNALHSSYGTGADNAMFTGFYLAAASFRYGVTQEVDDLIKIRDTINGIHLLTHVTNTPGVLVRLAFPLEDAWNKIGYDVDNQDAGNTWTRRRKEGSLYEEDSHFFYAKTTRDQLAGVVYGLSVAWKIVYDRFEKNIYKPSSEGVTTDEIKEMNLLQDCINKIQEISSHLVFRLKSKKWSLKDHTDNVGDTNADVPSIQLRYALLLLNHIAYNRESFPALYSFKMKMFYKFIWLHTFYYRFTRRMYAWNVRTTIAFTLWWMTHSSNDTIHSKGSKKWFKRILKFTKSEDNPFFVFTENLMFGGSVSEERINRAWYEYNRHIERGGHNSFFAWQKPKGEADVMGDWNSYGPGIDILLPYWMNYYIQTNMNN